MTKTYTADILRIIRQQCEGTDIEFIDSNFTASGVEAVIRDRYDGQFYTIEIMSSPSSGASSKEAGLKAQGQGDSP